MVKGQTLGNRELAEKPAVPLSLRAWLLVERELGSSNFFVKKIALAMFLLLTAVLRFAHLQRSKYTGGRPSYLAFEATFGKARRLGVKKPMAWCAPKASLTGVDIQSLVE